MKLIHGRALLPLLLAAALACAPEGSGPQSDPVRTLARIDVTPSAPRLLVGSAERLYASAVYSDGYAVDVTAEATWTSSSEATLTVSTGGAVEALAPGTATVTVAWGSSSGSATATVVAADDASSTTFTGRVSFDFVPARFSPTGGGTLDFGASAPKPVRGAVVRVMQGTAVLAETTTDPVTGEYAVTFSGASGPVSLVALAKTLSPPIRVQDNTDGDAIWAVGKTGLDASPGATVAGLDLYATHGWTLPSGPYVSVKRIAAPFAILDAMFTAAQGLLEVRSPAFPALAVNWSPDNVASDGSTYSPADGLIVTSHYSPDEGAIFVLGKEGDDTDEFDAHVVVHEWGHYVEARLSRSDSPGGPHARGNVLDPRLAFGEGYGSALAAMLLPRATYGIYADTFWGTGGLVADGFDAETPPQWTDDPSPGPFSEFSIIRLLHDLWDDSGTAESWDGVALGVGPIYDVLVGPQKATPALTTIAPFIAALKERPDVDDAKVDALLAHYSIGPITDPWGLGDADLRAMYLNVAVPSRTAIPLDAEYYWNEQPQNRYVVFTAAGTTTRVTSSSAYDVDLYAYGSGTLLDFAESTSGNESLQFATVPGQVYVVVVTGWRLVDPGVNGSYSANVTVSTP